MLLITVCEIVSSVSCYYCSIKDFRKLNETLTWCKSKMSLEEIRIDDSNLTLLTNLVKKTPGIVHIILESNLTSFDINIGKNICKWKELKEIKIRNNHLKTLPSQFLFNCQQLNDLDLSKNAISQLKKDTFDNLSKLLVLKLDFNQLKTLHKDTFKPLSELLILHLAGNQLQTINADLFHHNPNLYTIDLQNNDLRVIKRSFRMLKELHFLLVSDNHNLDSLDLPHMGFNLIVNITNCNLKTLFIPPNVLKVFAANNQISFIGIHSNNTVQYLDIRQNKLNNLNIKSTEWLGNSRELNIKYNGSTHIDFIKLCPIEKQYFSNLHFKLNSEQSFNIVEIKNKFTSLKSISISSRGMNIERQTQIVYDCSRHDVHIRMDANDFF